MRESFQYKFSGVPIIVFYPKLILYYSRLDPCRKFKHRSRHIGQTIPEDFVPFDTNFDVKSICIIQYTIYHNKYIQIGTDILWKFVINSLKLDYFIA